MKIAHPHAAAIDRIGFKAITDYFHVTRQTVWRWKRTGVPERYRKTMAMLGAVGGLDVTELKDEAA